MKIKFISIFVVLLIFNMPLHRIRTTSGFRSRASPRGCRERCREIRFLACLECCGVRLRVFRTGVCILGNTNGACGCIAWENAHICCDVYPSLPRERETATDAVRCYRLCCKQSSEHGSPFVVSFRDELMLSSSKPT